MNIIVPPKWRIVRESDATPEDVFNNRRRFIKSAGLSAAVWGLGLSACAQEDPDAAGGTGGDSEANSAAQGAGATSSESPASQSAAQTGDAANGATETAAATPTPAPGLYPAPRDEEYKLDRAITAENLAGTHNNFYEFANSANGRNYPQLVHEYAEGYPFRPWQVEIGGLVNKPQTLTIDEIEKLAPLEERLYRHRCVERWAMAVPWTGYSFSKLLAAAEPKDNARFVRFVTFHDPDLPGVKKAPWYPWPYYEGLTMAEAMNELCLLCTGIYGHALPPEHGAPVRIVVPWKYGYKSIKSVVKIELTDEQPNTFWNDLQPSEYGFESNVNPNEPHPRWSQEFEYMLGEPGKLIPTQIYNGYGDYVAQLYA